ncbi:2-aminoethylphosphonate--pyruvate transaminase [Anaerotignum neopropionicum]|uniref:2-aminoethylphosphonate--pyruvate transaminase n=1 Tax=Anaerotignum neopropionicum TaxID=36847 RepID=A0A136WEL1_9FIRM|nr:aminotransferase class V-fold PLP-dependent enzyme [Anaerotignum neopropionicum]KXL52956.1 2-aminoethylphosphonate--pyruvate transaminase [Anaerotignum neopropionicum]
MSMTKLFSPGPVLVKDNVRHALLHYDICHRSVEFEEMFVDTQKKINMLFNADDSYESLIISGSGTSSNETVLSSLFTEGEGVLLIRNGMFGERLLEIITKYKTPLTDIAFPWGAYPDVAVIENAIAQSSNVKVVAMVFHETCTGMINPVKAVGELCKKYNKIFFVDCVSAAGGENIDVVENNISICTSVGGKCVGAFPGSAYVCAKREILEALTADQCKNVYLSLFKHYQSAVTAHQTPNTPNVTLFWPLNVALTNIFEDETLAGRIARYQKCAEIIREGLVALDCRLLLDEHMANTVTSVFLPAGVDNTAFLIEMEKRGYTFYAGKGDYAKQGMIQVANMGEIYEEDCYNMLEVFAVVLIKMQS